MKKEFIVAVVGQPNVGKSHLLNALSGANLKVGNFAGVTVEKAEAVLEYQDMEVHLIDLPGLYSLDEFSKDEAVAKNFLLHEKYDLILNVIDSTNLERNLYLSAELMALGKKMVMALNMDDEAIKEGIEIDDKYLSQMLNIPMVKVSSTQKTNFNRLLELIRGALLFEYSPNKLKFSDEVEHEIVALEQYLSEIGFKNRDFSNRHASILLLSGDRTFYKSIHDEPKMLQIQPKLKATMDELFTKFDERDLEEIFIGEYHAFAKGATMDVTKKSNKLVKNLTGKIDRLLIHKVYGIPIFLFLMWLLFQATFTLGELPMAYIESAFGWLGDVTSANLTNEIAKSIIVDGAIAGVGTVLLFMPNIIILFLGIALLETTGYMARVSFLLDGFFHKFGLHGKSFIPLVTGFGCSIPAYMAARTLKSEKDRLLTMFIIGFMSCGAKLPVYVLFVGAFFGTANAGNALFIIYISGAMLGLVAAKILSATLFKGGDEPFVMEMPKYRMPSARLIWFAIYSKSVMYLKKAGTFILAASILVWFVSTYPQNDLGESVLEETYLGMAGKAIEPVFEPIGMDWKMSVATLSGLAAKEVIVSTLGVLYALGDDVSEEDTTLQNVLVQNISFPSAVAFVVFVMVYLPCLAATAVFRKESGSLKYTLFLVIFTFGAAWILAFVTYHGLMLLGY